jgi:hypothetical protein
MSAITVVTTSTRHDLDDEAREAFRTRWPEFIFHDPISNSREADRGTYSETNLWIRHR